MGRISTHRVDVFFKRLLDVNERALPRAVAEMLQGGNHDGIIAFLYHLKPSEFAVHFPPMSNMVNDDAVGH